MNSKMLYELLSDGLQIWLKGDQIGFKVFQGKLSPELREKLIAAKPELLSNLLSDRRYSLCSFPQQRLWFLEQFDGANPVYNIHATHLLEGELNIDALQQSVNRLLKRHEAFRTSFHDIDGQPYQQIHDAVSLPIPVVDLTTIAENDRDKKLQELLVSEVETEFDLSKAPLIRVKLFKLEPDKHALLLLTHHIIFDGWSRGLTINELSETYSAICNGNLADETMPSVQYSDHVMWQREWFKGDNAQKQLEYWTEKLSGELAPLELPFDMPRPPIQSTEGGVVFGTLDPELVSKLSQRAREENVSLFMYLITIANLLMHRFSNQTDILLGMPVANRKRKEVEGVIGYFANTLVLRNDLAGDPTFRELLGKVRAVCLEAFNNEDTPFEQIVGALQPERDRSRTPIFQSMFSYIEEVDHASAMGDVKMSRLLVERQVARTDLAMWFTKNGEQIRYAFEYASQLFEHATMQQLVTGFKILAEAAAENPESRISALPAMPEDVKHKLLVGWNDTQVDYPREANLPKLFESTAASNSDRPAAIYSGEEITYDALNRQSNRLAHYLLKNGVKAGDKVGICMERSLDMLVGLLGIMKTGAAYVPMDPGFPEDRLAYMCEDAAIEVLLSEQAQSDLLSGFEGRRLIYDDLAEVLAEEEDQNPDVEIDPESLIYVIYTSGSTGKPKGVALPHRAVANFLNSMAKRPGLSSEDRLLAVTTLSFDIAVLELYLPLTQGACVVIASRDDAADDARLRVLLEQEKISVMQATPVSWQMLLDGNWRPAPGFKALCGGEAMPVSLRDSLLAAGVELWNMYGPTETCVWSCIEQMHMDEEKVLIGRPIDNTQVYILDKALQPVPPGVTGELYIGGDGLAAGYLNREELTAERFVSDPFAEAQGAKMYCTGDLARFLPDGRLECLGRTDFQVKIRGYRIELGEIENVLNEYKTIDQSVVTVKEFGDSDKRLVAYVLSSDDIRGEEETIRSFLRAHMPEYMVPTYILQLNDFPMTPNGKIDRKALPMPDMDLQNSTTDYQAPENEVETKLCEIWGEILAVEKVGTLDNFFDLGGHSLLATRLIGRVNETFEINMKLPALFEYPTIATLAETVRMLIEEHETAGPGLTEMEEGII